MENQYRRHSLGVTAIKLTIVMLILAVGMGGGYVAYLKLTAPKHFANLLPKDTLLYVRMKGIDTLKDNWVHREHLQDVKVVQEKIDEWYKESLEKASQNTELKEQTLKDFVQAFKTFHLAVCVQEKEKHRRPNWIVFLEMANREIIDKLLKELGDQAKEKKILDQTVYDVRGSSFISVIDKNIMILSETEELLQTVLEIKSKSGSETLANSRQFQKAHDDMGRAGDLFLFFNLANFITEESRDAELSEKRTLPDWYSPEMKAEAKKHQEKQRAMREEIKKFFSNLDFVAGAADPKGSLTLRLYTVEGKTLPEFLVRKSRSKELFKHIPASAPLVYDVSYDGGKKTRQSFKDWFEKEVPKELVPREVQQAMGQLDQLENEVVVIAQDFWAAVLPVDKEMAMYIAPSDKGWEFAVFFDYEDKAQVETLAKKLFEEGKRHQLPWEETTYEGLTIHYLDISKILPATEVAASKELAKYVQLQMGYAISDRFFMIGSVEALKFIHKPKGDTLYKGIALKGVDKKNAVQLVLQPGYLCKALSKIDPLKQHMDRVIRQIPENASYSVTLTLEEKQATVRTNIPFTSLIAWIALDLTKSEISTSAGKKQPRSSPRIQANEGSAMATLRSLCTSQVQMMKSAIVDQDQDGTGEYGFIQEMAGTANIRGKDEKISLPFMQTALGETAAKNNGVAMKSGYYFYCYLPGNERAIGEQAGKMPALSPGDSNAINLQETYFVIYAWPVEPGKTGNRAFVIDQSGEVLACNDPNYTLANKPNPEDAYSKDSPNPKNLEGNLANDQPGMNGKIWTYRQ